MIILYCVQSSAIAEEMITQLQKFRDYVPLKMFEHLFDLVNEIFIFENHLLPTSAYSPVTTPRLIPLIYRLIDKPNMFYRETDQFSYEFINQSLSELSKLETEHKKQMLELNVHRDAADQTIIEFEGKIEKVQRSIKSNDNEKALLKAEAEIEEFEGIIKAARKTSFDTNETMQKREDVYASSMRSLLNNTNISYDSSSNIYPVQLSKAERTALTTKIDETIPQPIIRATNLRYEKLLEEKGDEEAVEDIGIKNYQIFSNILSRLGSKFHNFSTELTAALESEEFTMKDFDHSSYAELLRTFSEDKMSNRGF